jgi:hypothetical protein
VAKQTHGLVLALDSRDQFAFQVRPVVGDRIGAVVADAFDCVNLEAAREAIEHLLVARCRKAVTVRELQDRAHPL